MLSEAKSQGQSKSENYKEWLLDKGFGTNTANDYNKFIEKKFKPYLHGPSFSFENNTCQKDNIFLSHFSEAA